MEDEQLHEEMEDGGGFTLADFYAILRMQRWVVIGAVVVALALSGIWTAVATRYYTSRATVHIVSKRVFEMDVGKLIEDGSEQFDLRTRTAILQSTSMMLKVLEDYEKLDYDDGLKADAAGVGLLAKSVSYIPRKGTRLVDIVATTTDPELSARLANLMANTLRDDSQASAIDAANDASEWLAAQMVEYESKYEEVGDDLREFQREHDLADIEQVTTSLTARLTALKSAYAGVSTERVQLETGLRLHRELLAAGAYDDLSVSLNDSIVSALVHQYTGAATAFALTKTKFLPKWPAYVDAENKVQTLEKELRREIARAITSEETKLGLLRDRERDIEEAIDAGHLELLNVESLKDRYERMKLDRDNAVTIYTEMHQRDAELELQAKTQLNNVRIVEDARPNYRPTSPNVLQNLLAALVLGLVGGLGAAFLIEWFDDSISSPHDVTMYLRARLLGIIPQVKDADSEVERSLYTHEHPRSNVAEAIRGIRTVIELDPSGEPPKRLMVTSALSGEGKTSTTLRLALAYANLGRKVVVVDADMRRPRIHKVFGHERVPGLATALIDEVDVDATLHPTPIDNLSFMAAGKAFDRPNELLTSDRFEQLLEELDERFDMVFVDTPPSVILSDARLISRHMDAVMIVAKERAASRMMVREALRGLRQVHANVLGVVINGVEFTRRNAYAYYGYGYGYEYAYSGYSYGTEDEQAEEGA